MIIEWEEPTEEQLVVNVPLSIINAYDFAANFGSLETKCILHEDKLPDENEALGGSDEVR